MTSDANLILLPPDNPIDSSKEDVLDWTAVAKTFAQRTLSLDSTKGLVIGVFGSWGSGKTSFVNLARLEFVQENIPILDFNPWLFSGTDQLVCRFFVELSAAMGETSTIKKLIRELFQQYGEHIYLAMVTISPLMGGLPVGEILINLRKCFSRKKEAQASAIRLRKELTKTLADCSKPIVVVLDDVDRLSIDEIRVLFKLVRLTASFPNLIYIIACDRLHVEAALGKDEPRLRGNFLEKIFQWSINVPSAHRPRLREELLKGIKNALGNIDPPFTHEDWPDIETEIILPLIRNMRDIRRYSMAVQGTIDDLGTMVAVIDILALEAVRLFMPSVFDDMRHLVMDLTVLPVGEGNQQRMDDIISEQMDDTKKSNEARQTRLEELIEAADQEHRMVVRALIHRLFSGGRSQHNEQDSEWPAQQLRRNRVVHANLFKLYMTRVADGDLMASNNAKRAFECLHDKNALHGFMHAQDPETWTKTLLYLWDMFRNDFVRKHAESSLVVFWNLLPDMPGRNSMFADEPLKTIQLISESFLVRLIESSDIVDQTNSILGQIQSFSSRVAFVSQIKGLDIEKDTLFSDVDIRTLEQKLNNQILPTDPDELAKERHPAQVLMFVKRQAEPPMIRRIIHDSPKLTFALLWDCQTQSSSSELESRAIEIKRSIHWETMIAIHGDKQTLETRLESLAQNFEGIAQWIETELGIPSSDARSILQFYKTYETG